MADCMGLRREPYFLRTRNGACCEIRPGSSDWWVFLEVFVFGNYGRVSDDVRCSKVVVDIGANVGFFAIFASTLNPEVEIHAFEPFPKNLEQMKRNLLLNPACRISVHSEAVSDKNADVLLYFMPGDDSGCTLSESKAKSCCVKAVSASELFNICGIGRCDLLKMDCEGSELSILQAASSDVLAKIRTIIMEYHDPVNINILSDILSRSGFKCEVITQIKTLYASRG